MYLLYRHLRSQRKSWYVFVASMLVFSGLNLLENLVHYSIGRGRGSPASLRLVMPDVRDLVRIIGVMLIFAVANAVFMSVLLA